MSILLPSAPDLLDELLAPLSDDAPCGRSLRYEPAFDRLRELRREDDASLPAGVWQSEAKRGEWPAVEKLATQVLKTRSKDLMVAAWLGEAWLHRYGYPGLAPALALLAGLCERYPEDLHPQAEEGDQSWRATPLDWMARHYAQILHTRIPLPGDLGGDFSAFTLYEWQQLQRRQVVKSDSKAAKSEAELAFSLQQKLNERVRETPLGLWQQCADTLESSFRYLQQLDTWSDTHLVDLAPSYSPLRETMTSMTSLVQAFIALHPAQPVQVEPALTGAAYPEEKEEPALQTLNNREDAYRQLALIADFLAKTEPHSPVPYLIRRAVEWGNKPLNELLTELISADAEARRVWSLLGVLK
ncbi:type VI secretion system protein TssA [Phytopseudomonas dryadis]|uniref:Type VI secretion system protein TssA n=1 Tax=Phytopseudomonas dryadis TaxID=2487520 RepID=A0A4Q9R554_9GAMM|nr:type VI secretion system protein TssA [Pseudomonas dryadis]TBU95641.1 type VI secretion system protein TssA [Pseudomonas dryadis]